MHTLWDKSSSTCPIWTRTFMYVRFFFLHYSVLPPSFVSFYSTYSCLRPYNNKVGNGHKWLYSPKGSAFLYVRRALQSLVHPTVISFGYPTGFQPEFEWTGTRVRLYVPASPSTKKHSYINNLPQVLLPHISIFACALWLILTQILSRTLART